MKRKLLVVLFLGLFLNAFSQMPGWDYQQPITVTENSGSLVTNYQLRLILDTETPITATHMNGNGDDIRFTASCTGGTHFNYWIESGINTPATVIWVNIDTLPASSGRTIYMHYGNDTVPAVSAIPGTFAGPHSATDSVSGGAAGGVTDSQRGIRFAANEDILVTSFGKNEPNGSTRYITLFDNASQAILRQMQVSGPAAQYTYTPLAAPIWLNQGQQYILEMHQGGTDGYYFGPSNTQIGQHLTYMDMRYCNGCDQNTFPNNYLNAIHYGYPDLWYYTRNQAMPAPTYSLGSYSTVLADEIAICLEDTATLALSLHGGEAPFTYTWSGGAVSDGAIAAPTAVPSDTMEYFVTTTDACGVVRADSITVNVKPLPSLAIFSSASLICNGEFSELSVPNTTDTYVWDNGSTDTMIVATPSVTTTYSVTATNVHGCSDVFTYEQLVNVPFTATHDVAICANDFHVVGNHSYNLDGTYIDTLAGFTSCDSIVTTNLTMIPLPAATQNRLICFGTSYTIGQHTYSVPGTYIDTIAGSSCDSIITTNLAIAEDIDAQIQAIQFTLVADVGADGYAWVDCNNGNAVIPGATGPVYEATTNGSYAAMLTVGNCTKVSNCITIATIGLEEADMVENILVYPNPNNGTFTVQSSVSQDIRLLDALGKEITTIAVTAGQPLTIELKTVQSGIYFLNARTKVVRVVVE